MHNPDPKKYAVKKLRGREEILIDRAILKWRKARIARKKAQDALSVAVEKIDSLYNPQEPTLKEELAYSVPLPFNLFSEELE